MAISHIPRSVGHNFAPEYQISAVPYVVNIDSDKVSTFYVKKNDNSAIVGHSETNTGFVHTHGVVPDTDIFDDDVNVDGVIQDSEKKANNLKVGFTLVEVKTIKLPKISQWIQFIPDKDDNDGIQVAFSRTDHLLTKTIKFLDNSKPGDATVQSMFYPVPFRIRCTNLYFNDLGVKGKLLVGLTSIDRSEFTEVVETFLGD